MFNLTYNFLSFLTALLHYSDVCGRDLHLGGTVAHGLMNSHCRKGAKAQAVLLSLHKLFTLNSDSMGKSNESL